jgi:hypothetical protein
MPLCDPIYGQSGQPTVQFPINYAPPVTPVSPYTPQAVNQPPYVKIVTVDGESAAKSLKLAPGSTLLATDEKESVIWFIKANEVGPNTVFQIPFDPAVFNGGSTTPSVDLSAIEGRLSEMEERMSRYESNARTDKQQSGNHSNGRN